MRNSVRKARLTCRSSTAKARSRHSAQMPVAHRIAAAQRWCLLERPPWGLGASRWRPEAAPRPSSALFLGRPFRGVLTEVLLCIRLTIFLSLLYHCRAMAIVTRVRQIVTARPPTFGEYLRSRRLAAGLTLTELGELANFDAANLSRLERGLMPPPASETVLERLSRALAITKHGLEWHIMMDLAAAARGRLPGDLQRQGYLPEVFTRLREEQRELREVRPNPQRAYSLADAIETLMRLRQSARQDGEQIIGLHVITSDARRVVIGPIRDAEQPSGAARAPAVKRRKARR